MTDWLTLANAIPAVGGAIAGGVTSLIGVKYLDRQRRAEISSTEGDAVEKATHNVSQALDTLDGVLERLEAAEQRNARLSRELQKSQEQIAELKTTCEKLQQEYQELHEEHQQLLDRLDHTNNFG